MRIEVKNLTHIYSSGMPFETVALHDVSFTVESGEFAALIGHTGSGKSTLAEHIIGLLKPNSGEVLFDGVDIASSRELRKKVGMVFQYPEYQLFEEDVISDVCYGPKNLGFSEEEAKAKAFDALRLVGLDPEVFGAKSPFALSGGEKRRVAIAGVLAMEPSVLILDEPTAGLDPAGRNDILALIKKIKEEREITIFLVSHDMDAVANMADHVLVMDSGALVLEGSPAQVFAQGPMLRSIGLELPSAARLIEKLRARGLDIPGSASAFTADDAAKLILEAWQ